MSVISCDSKRTQASLVHQAFPWARTWVLALMLASTTLGSEDMFWRRKGHRPNLSNSQALKMHHRARITDDAKTIVLLGRSRAQAAFSSQTFRAHFPESTIVNLAGGSEAGPIPELQALAAGREFRGTVICGLIAPDMFSVSWDTPLAHTSGDAVCFDKLCKWRLQDSLVILNQSLALRRVLAGKLPNPDLARLRFDRSLELDFRVIDDLCSYRHSRHEHYRYRYRSSCRFLTYASFLEGVAKIEDAVQAIQRRGGRVVFVRYPSTGMRLALEAEFHPREDYWDVFSRKTSAQCIHFLDIPAMRLLDCPDESHVDMRTMSRCSNTLIEVLKGKML